MPKRILILTDSIAPPAYAPRVVSLCRYLVDKGYVCDVFSDCEEGVKPFSANFGNWHHTAYYQTKSGRLHYIADKLFGARERYFKTCIEKTIHVADYDTIFCSTCYYFPLQTAYQLARKYHKPFIVDLRDIAEQWGNVPYMTNTVSSLRIVNIWLHRFFTFYNCNRRNHVLRAAKHVISISPWHRDLLAKYNPSTHLIYNGFDENEFYPKNVINNKFIISYSGKIYNLDFRDPRLLFEALQHIFEEKRIKRSDVELVFHIDKNSINALQLLVARYRLSDICHIDGYITKEQLLPLMHDSSILLILTCKSTQEGVHGIMGTKFYEALGCEKPVLCVRSDEDCLAQTITQTDAGLAGTNVTEVMNFILDKYHEWQDNGFTRQSVKNAKIFTRQFQSEQIEKLL